MITSQADYERAGQAGTWWLCENGHRICQVIDTIPPGDAHWPSKLGNWQQREPVGEIDPPCAVCGASWWPLRKIA